MVNQKPIPLPPLPRVLHRAVTTVPRESTSIKCLQLIRRTPGTHHSSRTQPSTRDISHLRRRSAQEFNLRKNKESTSRPQALLGRGTRHPLQASPASLGFLGLLLSTVH